jgi:uncharacterized protein (DUF302 family)
MDARIIGSRRSTHVRKPDSAWFDLFVRICLDRIIAGFCWRGWHRHGEKRLSNRRDDRAFEEGYCRQGYQVFNEIDQSKLAAGAGIKLRPSVLLIFGNPPLGTQFITANANAGLDWPVRLLIYENEKGEVWAAYTDFDWIARRHGIENRNEQFNMASGVVTSITSSVRAK